MRTTRPRTRLLLLALTVLVAASALLPAAAQAQLGRRWPGSVITYFDATRDKDAVSRAVRAWNGTGAKISFRRTMNRQRANIVISNTRNVPAGCGTGQATLGYLGGQQGWVHILHGAPKDGQGCAWPGQTFVVTHELGHVLGLDHDDRACSLMNTSHTNGVAASRCLGAGYDAHRASWRCRLIEPRDVSRVIRMYGGRAKPVRTNPWCDLVERPDPPSAMTASAPENLTVATVTFTRAADKPYPAFLAGERTFNQYELYRTQSTCLTARPAAGSKPSSDSIVASFMWDAQPGEQQTVTDAHPEPAGPWCWAAWSIDAFGRPSRVPATALVDVPAIARSRAWIPGAPDGASDVQPTIAPQEFALDGDGG